MSVHFLHIGKTGGTAIKFALKPFTHIFLHSHNTKLSDIPTGHKVAFFVRDPVSRFVSAFFSRRRMGLPRIHIPWSDNERIAFENFATPNNLAESLTDPSKKNFAMQAMRSIGHIRTHFWDWFGCADYLENRRNDILFVGAQENLSEDFERLKTILNIPSASLPTDDINTHKNPIYDKHLSELSIINLRRWYDQDYQFIDICKHRFGLRL